MTNAVQKPRIKEVDKYLESLWRIVHYLEHDEEKHWKESGEPMDHIVCDVWRLKMLFQSLIHSDEVRRMKPSEGGLTHYFQYVQKHIPS